MKAFVRRTGRPGKEKEAESYILDFFLQIINGCLTPPPSPPSSPLARSLAQLCGYQNCQFLSDEKSQVSFPQLSRKLWPQELRERRVALSFLSVRTGSAVSSLGDSSYQDISTPGKNWTVNKDQKCFSWYFNFSFSPFFPVLLLMPLLKFNSPERCFAEAE